MSEIASLVAPVTLRLGLIGSPNAGKTTLFNALTGLRAKVGNYSGVTVERREGETLLDGRPAGFFMSRTTPFQNLALGIKFSENLNPILEWDP